MAENQKVEQAIVPHDDPRGITMPPTKPEKYVVLHSGISIGLLAYRQGSVTELDTLDDSTQRLMALNAIRQATEEEAGLERVEVKAEIPAAGSSYEELLAQKQKEVEDLRAKLAASHKSK